MECWTCIFAVGAQHAAPLHGLLGIWSRVWEEIGARPQDDHFIFARQLTVDQPAPPLGSLHGFILDALTPDKIFAAIARRQPQIVHRRSDDDRRRGLWI